MPSKAPTTRVLMDNELVLYRRERSSIWQCRFKVDGVWQRATTKERDERKARTKAKELLVTAEIRKRENLPVVTRNFRHVANLAIERMEAERSAGKGIVSYADYIRITNDYLTPFFGKRSITSIDYGVLDEFETWRTAAMEKAPSRSTMQMHNAALNRIFDEAVVRGFLSMANRPKLDAKGKKSDRRPAFDVNEVRKLLGAFDVWIEKGRNDRSKEMRSLLRDYVEVLLDTGARPGDELMNLKWKQIKYNQKIVEKTEEYKIDPSSADPPESGLVNVYYRSCEMTVSGKTGTRQILGMGPTVKALIRILRRNYGIKNYYFEPFKGVVAAVGDDYVFRTKAKEMPESFQKMFEEFLRVNELLVDPQTEQRRVFYSLRHSYATFALTHDQVPIHTLAKQMGTSVLMIERHYSHLKVPQAIEQLRGEATRQLFTKKSIIAALQEEQSPRLEQASASELPRFVEDASVPEGKLQKAKKSTRSRHS